MTLKFAGYVAAAALITNVAIAADMPMPDSMTAMDAGSDSAAEAITTTFDDTATAMPAADEAMPTGEGEKLEDYMMDAKAAAPAVVASATTTDAAISAEAEALVASMDASASTVSATTPVSESVPVSATIAVTSPTVITSATEAAAMKDEIPVPPEMNATAPSDAPAEDPATMAVMPETDDMMGTTPVMMDAAVTETVSSTTDALGN